MQAQQQSNDVNQAFLDFCCRCMYPDDNFDYTTSSLFIKTHLKLILRHCLLLQFPQCAFGISTAVRKKYWFCVSFERKEQIFSALKLIENLYFLYLILQCVVARVGSNIKYPFVGGGKNCRIPPPQNSIPKKILIPPG